METAVGDLPMAIRFFFRRMSRCNWFPEIDRSQFRKVHKQWQGKFMPGSYRYIHGQYNGEVPRNVWGSIPT